MTLPIKTAAELIDPELEARWTLRRADRQSEMLRHIWRAFLVQGRPIPVDALARDLADASPDSIRETLARLDAQDLIWVEDEVVPAYPFSGDPTEFTVVLADGRARFACCAIDALGIAPMLGQPITIRSRCHHCGAALRFAADPEGPGPDAGGVMVWTVRLTVGPGGVQAVSPAEAVISIAIVDPEGAALATVEAIWRTFCRQIHFFASREEAERWAARRGDIAILTPDEGHRIGRLLVSRFLGQTG